MAETDQVLQKLSDKDYCTPKLDIRPVTLLVTLMAFAASFPTGTLCQNVRYNRLNCGDLFLSAFL